MNKKDILNKFKTKTKEITVKAWDDAVVEIRELTVMESNEVQALMLNDSTGQDIADGNINVSIGKFEEAKIRAVSMALVSPKFSEVEISNMGSGAKNGINEIYEAIGAINEPKK